ncbi:MAG: PIN domain-containing protein [Anaerolineae bacterium]
MIPIDHTMPPQTLCIADASILFDLRNGRILAVAARLPYRFSIPDAVFWEELDAPLRKTVQSLGFVVDGVEGTTIAELSLLRPKHPELSAPDLLAFFLARDRQAVLLTGDRRLRRLAETRGLVVHGTLWMLDELWKTSLLTSQAVLAAMERILALGGRLPAEEYQKRRLLWRQQAQD